MITSLHNEKIKLAKALQTAAKTRRKEGKIVLEGARLVRDALLAGHVPEFVLVAAELQPHPPAPSPLVAQQQVRERKIVQREGREGETMPNDRNDVPTAGGTTHRSSPTGSGAEGQKSPPHPSPAYRGGSKTDAAGDGQDKSVGDHLLELLRRMGVEPLLVNDAVMAHVSETQQPQGIVGVFPLPRVRLPEMLKRILILDAIRDPGNLGTILRTAAAAGVEAVLLSPTCVDPYNPKALRAGMGAHFRVALAEMNWEEIADVCQHSTIYMADGGGEARYDAVDWREAWALIIGGEAYGAGEAARQLAQTRICIPMAAETESLNAAAAAGVILFEAAKYAEEN